MTKRKTKENFINESIHKHGDKYDYSLVEYKNNHTKIKILCPKHGIFEMRPNDHTSKLAGCNKCNNASISKSNNVKKNIISRFIKKHNDKYDYSLVEYTGTDNKIKIICPEHGEFEQTPHHHLNGHGCSVCVGLKKLTTEEFILKSKKIHGEKYDYSLVDYKNNHSKVEIICSLHGIFKQTGNNHLSGSGCKKCLQYDVTNFLDNAINIHNNKYDYSLIDYKNRNTKIKIICPEHGVFEQIPSLHLRGSGCQKCGTNIRSFKNTYTNEEFILRAKEMHNDKYDYSEVKYVKIFNKVQIICRKHGIFEQRASDHISGCGCKKCFESNGEKKIRLFLEDNNIRFISQKRFNDCRNINPLPFDFYIPELNICIEYDGEQHFEIVGHWGGENALKEIKKRDEIKNEYCSLNNIVLLRLNKNTISRIDEFINQIKK